MKTKMRLIAAAVAAAAALSATGAPESLMAKDHLFQLLDSRIAGNRQQMTNSVRKVAADAADGNPLHRYLLAVFAGDLSPAMREELRLDDETVRSYGGYRRVVDRLARDKNNSLAQYLLSLAETNAERRVRYLERAVKGNNLQALNELGLCYLNGVGVRRNPAKAFGFFRRAADQSDPNGCYNYGYCLFHGLGCTMDRPAAVAALRSADRGGQPQAMNLLGVCYRDGIVCNRDPAAAAAFFRRSSKCGLPDGCLNYGLALIRGEGEEKDEAAGLEYVRMAAECRFLQGMYEYADALLNGIGEDAIPEGKLVGKELDDVRAANAAMRAERRRTAFLYLYHCAIRLDHPPSIARLGDCYLEGFGTERNERAAVQLYHRAAIDYRYGPAMVRMAECCDGGIGGLEPSHEDALWWRTFERARAGDRCARIWFSRHDPHRFDVLPPPVKGGRQ